MNSLFSPSEVRQPVPGSPAETVVRRTWKIAVLPGDGIGSEVMAEGLKVLGAVAACLQGVAFALSEHPVGAAEYLRHGNPLPESSFAACEQADAILLGAMGLPSVRWPDGKEMTPQIDLREWLDLYNGVLPSMAYFRGIFDEVAQEYPDVHTEHLYVDAAALFLVQKPHRFDVLVTENMFGDILSDLAAGLVGGMGMAPSADIGDRHAVFQPSHGSAPDIAGQGMANPIAMILSVALMLDWLGTEQTQRGAATIRRAVENVLSHPDHCTMDLGGKLTTTELADLIIGNLEN